MGALQQAVLQCFALRPNNTYFRLLDFSAVGKFSGTGIVTSPVAAHSAPRSVVVMKPMQSIE
jgi:hypothetical protein